MKRVTYQIEGLEFENCLGCPFAIEKSTWNDNSGRYTHYKQCPFQIENGCNVPVAKLVNDTMYMLLSRSIFCPIKKTSIESKEEHLHWSVTLEECMKEHK